MKGDWNGILINFGHGYLGDQGHSSKVKNVDDWLPVTGNRNASWWYATFHNVTAMVGAGVLGLPNAMVYMTWCVPFFLFQPPTLVNQLQHPYLTIPQNYSTFNVSNDLLNITVRCSKLCRKRLKFKLSSQHPSLHSEGPR